jgi:hypothetical protein
MLKYCLHINQKWKEANTDRFLSLDAFTCFCIFIYLKHIWVLPNVTCDSSICSSRKRINDYSVFYLEQIRDFYSFLFFEFLFCITWKKISLDTLGEKSFWFSQSMPQKSQLSDDKDHGQEEEVIILERVSLKYWNVNLIVLFSINCIAKYWRHYFIWLYNCWRKWSTYCSEFDIYFRYWYNKKWSSR